MHPAQIAAYHIHYLLAIVLAIYGFAALWLDSRLKKNQPISHATRQAHKQYAITVKVMQYLTIITLLTGLRLKLNPFSVRMLTMHRWFDISAAQRDRARLDYPDPRLVAGMLYT